MSKKFTMNVAGALNNGWMQANMFIEFQMMVSTDMEGNITVEGLNYNQYTV